MPNTTTPIPGKPYFIITEAAERQLWRSRLLLKTLADLAADKGELHLHAEGLSVTLDLAAELLDLPMTYVTKYTEGEDHE